MDFLRERWQWFVISALACVTLVLGYIGFLNHVETGPSATPLDLVYLTLQLFGLESGGVPQPVPWQLQVARFLAPVVALWTLLKGLAVLFREEFNKARLWIIHDHSIICGLGRKGLELVRECRAAGQSVVAIDVDPHNDNLRVCRHLGAVVLVGDAADELLLKKARVSRARELVATTESDGINILAVMHACQLTKALRSDLMGPLSCYVHVVDLKLCNLFKSHRIFTDTADKAHVKVFNIYENTARQLFSEHPLDRVHDPAHTPATIHLILVGFGQMGESLAVQAAKLGHFAQGDQLKISVIDARAKDKEKSFESRYPYFREVCPIEFHQGYIDDLGVLAVVEGFVNMPGTLPRLAICLDNDLRNLSTAMALYERMLDVNLAIFVRMADETGITSLLDELARNMGEGPRVIPFGMLNHISRRRTLLAENQDRMARILHEEYVEAEIANGREVSGDAMQPWEKLPPGYRDSNRQAADYISVKLRAIGCWSGPPGMDGEAYNGFTPKEIELMAQLEHRRWMAEKYLAGWSKGPRDNRKKKHNLLVPWSKLSKENKQKDRNSVTEIPHLLEVVGETIYRTNAPRPSRKKKS